MTDERHPVPFDERHPAPNRTRAKPRVTGARVRVSLAPRATGMTVRQAVADYLLARTDYAASTHVEHASILRRFARYAQEQHWPPIAELGSGQVRSWLASLNQPVQPAGALLSKARKNKLGSVVRTFLKWCVTEGIAAEHVAKNVHWPPAPKLTDSMIAMSADDLGRLLGACDLRTWHGVRDYAIITVLYDTGIRRGELIGMRLGDVEGLHRPGAIVAGKSGTRAVGYGTNARRALRDYLDRARYAVATDHDALWIAWDGAALGLGSVRQIIDRLKRRAGIEGRVYPHKLRHTFATDFLRNGGNAYTLQMALGHASPIVTSNYVHLAQADVERSMRENSPADRLAAKGRGAQSPARGAPAPPSSARAAGTLPPVNTAASGERHGMAKLDWEKVRTIRARFAAGGISQAALCREYEISKATMHALIHQETWRE